VQGVLGREEKTLSEQMHGKGTTPQAADKNFGERMSGKGTTSQAAEKTLSEHMYGKGTTSVVPLSPLKNAAL
jgi:hypothetical protein